MTFENKIVWITGATSGIGEALVYAFNLHKAKIIISARREEELKRVRENCNENKSNIYIFPLDVANHEQIYIVANEVLTKFGNIDILVNNAGISQRALAKDTLLEVDKKIMNVNYFGTVALTKALLPSMLKNRSGHIVVISSLFGKVGMQTRTAYAASKHALQGFFDSLRCEIYKENVLVTLVCPGGIKTNISINALKGDGTSFNQKDEVSDTGLEANVLCKGILKAIENKKEEVYIGGKEMLAIYLKRFFPLWYSKMIRKREAK